MTLVGFVAFSARTATFLACLAGAAVVSIATVVAVITVAAALAAVCGSGGRKPKRCVQLPKHLWVQLSQQPCFFWSDPRAVASTVRRTDGVRPGRS